MVFVAVGVSGWPSVARVAFYYASSSFYFVRVPLPMCTRNIPACIIY
jgi:hypothetical protein